MPLIADGVTRFVSPYRDGLHRADFRPHQGNLSAGPTNQLMPDMGATAAAGSLPASIERHNSRIHVSPAMTISACVISDRSDAHQDPYITLADATAADFDRARPAPWRLAAEARSDTACTSVLTPAA